MRASVKGFTFPCAILVFFFSLINYSRAQGTPTRVSDTTTINAFAETDKPVATSDAFQPGKAVPIWRHGGLMQYLGGSEVSVWDKAGNRKNITVTIPSVSIVRLDDFDLDRDGNLYASGMADDDGGRSPHFIARVNKTTGDVSVIRTGNFIASRLCVNPSGDVWALGRRARQSATGPAYPMLRLYSFQKGRLLGFLQNTTVQNAEKSGFKTPFSTGSSVRNHPDVYGVTAQIASCTATVVDVFSPETNEWIHLDVPTGALSRIAIDSSAVQFEPLKMHQSFGFIPGLLSGDGYGTAYLLSRTYPSATASGKKQLFMLHVRNGEIAWKDVSGKTDLESSARLADIFGVEGRSLAHWPGDGQMHFAIPNPDLLEK